MNYGKSGKGFKIVLAILIIGIAIWQFNGQGKRRGVSGIPDPVQTQATGQTKIFSGDYTLNVTYLYEYDIKALVVSTHNYSSSNVGDKISPRDLALAWGPVAAYNNVVDFNWRQSGRWYYWNVKTYEEIDKVGGVAGVTQHSSNNHIIPADDNVRRSVNKIKVGDYVRLKGYLVSIEGSSTDGKTFSWSSSTSRSDDGNHACEVIYVTSVEWMD